jgi:hypothetical protein
MDNAKRPLTPAQIAELRSYLEKPNHGHGLFYGVTGQLYRAGYLTLDWTGAKDWTLSINDKGRRLFESLQEESK